MRQARHLRRKHPTFVAPFDRENERPLVIHSGRYRSGDCLRHQKILQFGMAGSLAARATFIGSIDGAFELLAIMDIRARSISFTTRPRRPKGPPDHERAGETFLHLLFPTRRPRRGSQLLPSGLA